MSGPLGGRGGGGEEWEGLLCRETERERENQQLSNVETFTIILTSIWSNSNPFLSNPVAHTSLFQLEVLPR